MHIYQGLLWEQWQQSRYWIVGSAVFLVMMTAGVWVNHDRIIDTFGSDSFELDKLAWVVGFTAVGLMFVNQRIHDVSLHFPRRQFVLPCRTLPLVISHLLFKSAIAVFLGMIIAVYHWVLLEQAQPSPLPVLLFLAMAAAAQALVMLATIAGPWLTLTTGAAGGAVAMFLYVYLDERRLDDGDAAALTALAIIAAGWAGALACAPAARRGQAIRSGRTNRGRGAIAAFLPRPVRVQWEFASPIWAQCWYEWRRTLHWLTRAMVPAGVLGCLVWLAEVNGQFALAINLAAAIASGSACGYFLLRVPGAEARFTLARPGVDLVLVNAKLVAALLAAIATSLISGIVWISGILIALFFGAARDADIMIDYLPWILAAEVVSLWVATTSAPIFFAGIILWAAFTVLVVAPVAALGSVHPILGLAHAVCAAVLLGYGLRHLSRKGIPIPWELAIVGFAFLPDILINFGYPLPLLEELRADSRIGFLAPLLLLLGGLSFAKRLGLISDRRKVRVFVGYLLASLGLITTMAVGADAGPLAYADVAYWWLAACFAPTIWVPLAIRIQRYQ